MKDALSEILDKDKYACIDSDEVGIYWGDYEGTDHESKYKDDTLAEAVRMAGGKDLLFIDNTDIPVEETSKRIAEFITA